MNGIFHFLGRALRNPRQLPEAASALVLTGYFWLLNLYERAPITQPDGPVVSLTTYGKRTRIVFLAIESIARGRLLPSRLILWIDDKAVFGNLPATLRRLAKRGLEIRLCENYGPHKKYYPYLESLQKVEVPLVTADDDLFYPRYWLQRLAEAFHQSPDTVNCYRARVIGLNQAGLAKYDSFTIADSTMPSFRHLVTGGAGAIYPPQLQRVLKQDGTAFLSCCPRADDLWLHVHALRTGYRVRLINKRQFPLVNIPATQATALCHYNQSRGGNDRQIALTYRASDVDRLREGE